jgi:predicted nucleic acid-binding protein
MIVVDTNLVVYHYVETPKTPLARRAFLKDPAWAAPFLWRSEFRNVLTLYLRQGKLSLADAVRSADDAQLFFLGKEYHVASEHVLRLVSSSRCSAYDCEYVAVAEELGVKLVTTDDLILKEFPAIAISLDAFVAE